ncbi:MAG TPA: TylF/MycF/NovP-related O-methyltransferase [Candidatus Saccharimonadales bacterium]|nr:TylF/MycF/NovP-related O-methyltransferase [Candidatus Saccharimonadales bacterium]
MTASSSQPNPDAYEFHRVANTPANQFRGLLLASDQVSKDDVALVWRELERVLAAGTPGAIVEFGCYVGTTSLFIRRLLDGQGQSATRPFHVYDSFEGLPPKMPADASAAGADFQAGKLSVSKKEFLRQFQAAHLDAPVVHKAWFNQLTAQDVPEQIAFAFLDGDFYDSILDSLRLVWPRLQPGATLLIDDYQRPELPGVERAVRDYFASISQPVPRLQVVRNIAVIRL